MPDWQPMLAGVDERVWIVAHTKPRCEKKLARHCAREGVEFTLPCYKVAHRYRGKTVVFEKPLFPGYVFLLMGPNQRVAVLRSNCVVRLLVVTDQELFEKQLDDIMFALQTGLEVRLAPQIGEGMRVRIKSGPLRGLEGWIEKRYGPNVVLLRLDFIGQAAAVKLDVCDVEPI
ncbi:MAG: antitermination protein NusG [Verrucomicrobiae bacterium]|nr:antitermination protein NusG [Verrucomicrobiae bacterium]MDW7979165.1 transcription termination/antitermination NusG family protein [Verrucomicrobiales bacterium]